MDEERLFHLALQKPTGDRDAFLDEACVGDAALRRRLKVLLESHANPGSFLTNPAGNPGAAGLIGNGPGPSAAEAPPATTTAEGTGIRIGPYRLLRAIGEGGMGTVFMAEQTGPVRRMVALKLIKDGMDSHRIVARFEAERQALALMDHPNIAKVHDAGTTAAGRPYFVMELVEGVPITRFCDERRLTTRERLRLFIAVCRAVQHAHQKGVIHRDLKPSNVLVAIYDGVPVPKVIDFGVAKAAGPQLTGRTLATEFGTIIGTLEYMSPEQAGLGQLDVDTRSDVYSLGVILYELLTGTTPVSPERVREETLLELLRVIREEEPPRPSIRLSTSGELASVAARRDVEPRKLSGLVRGELDWIVMKALEKDRTRRYETANGLAADLQRHLDDEPVQACPPSVWYRMRKLGRRNRPALAAVTAVAIALVAGMVASTWQMIRAVKAERLAERRLEAEAGARREAIANLRTARRAIDQMLTRVAADRLKFVPQMERLRADLLQDALTFYQELLGTRTGDPSLRREAGLTAFRLGHVYQQFGRASDAERSLDRAIALLEGLSARGMLDVEGGEALVRSYTELGWLWGRGPRAEVARRAALRRAEELLARSPDAPRRNLVAGACIDLGNFRRQSDPGETERLLRRAIELTDGPGGNPHQRGRAFLSLGELQVLGNQLGKAEGSFCSARDLYESVLREHPDLPQSRERLGDTSLQLGRVLATSGKSSEAAKAFGRAAELWKELRDHYPSMPMYREAHMTCLAERVLILSAIGRVSEAEDAFRSLDRDSLQVQGAEACDAVAWLYATSPEPRFRHTKTAVDLAKRAVDIAPAVGRFRRTLAMALCRAGEGEAALKELDQAKGEDRGRGGRVLAGLIRSMAYHQLGEDGRAREYFGGIARWEDNGPGDERLDRFRAEVAELLDP